MRARALKVSKTTICKAAGHRRRSKRRLGRKRCRMHGGAAGSGAPKANRNARKHGLFSRDAAEERKHGSCWKR